MDTVENEVGFALNNQGFPVEEVKKEVVQVLNLTGYQGSKDHSPFYLSGGEQRRVALASLLILNPGALLLDEPTVGMDALGLQVIRDIISKYRNTNRSVIIASHDLDFLYGAVDRFLVLNEGELVADFKTKDFSKYSSLIRKIGVGVPEIIRLQEREIPCWLQEDLNK